MFLIQRDHLVQDLPPATSDPALRQPFCQGACTPVRFGLTQLPATKPSLPHPRPPAEIRAWN